MKWISNDDPPLYVWEGDTWYNEKDKKEYNCVIRDRLWMYEYIGEISSIAFPRKTKIMTQNHVNMTMTQK